MHAQSFFIKGTIEDIVGEEIIKDLLWLVTHPTNLHPIGCLLHLLSQGLRLGARLHCAWVAGGLR